MKVTDEKLNNFIGQLDTDVVEKFLLECAHMRYKYDTSSKSNRKDVINTCVKGWSSFCAIYDFLIKPKV